MIISKGKLVACDTPDNLEKLFTGADTVKLVTEATEEEAKAILTEIPDVQAVDVEDSENGRLSLQLRVRQTDDDSVCRALFFAFAKKERAILQMSTARASLEDIFIELTAGEKSAAKKEDKK